MGSSPPLKVEANFAETMADFGAMLWDRYNADQNAAIRSRMQKNTGRSWQTGRHTLFCEIRPCGLSPVYGQSCYGQKNRGRE